MKRITPSQVRGYLLLCSHMRGYTTLLGHIFGSHPEITGYAEMHRRLRNRQELHRLAQRVAQQSRKSYRQRYVFDNLLHNHLPISQQVLRRSDVYPLLMVRAPKPTIESILRLQARFITSVEEAERYYVERLQQLQRIVEISAGKAMFLQGEALIQRTDETLQQLGNWLQLGTPLQQDYQRFQHTGKRKLGDSSDHIHAGRILSEAERKHEGALTITAAQIPRAEVAYEQFMDWLPSQITADKTVLA